MPALLLPSFVTIQLRDLPLHLALLVEVGKVLVCCYPFDECITKTHLVRQ